MFSLHEEGNPSPLGGGGYPFTVTRSRAAISRALRRVRLGLAREPIRNEVADRPISTVTISAHRHIVRRLGEGDEQIGSVRHEGFGGGVLRVRREQIGGADRSANGARARLPQIVGGLLGERTIGSAGEKRSLEIAGELLGRLLRSHGVPSRGLDGRSDRRDETERHGHGSDGGGTWEHERFLALIGRLT